MVLAEFLALIAAATPVPPAAAKPVAATYNAIVATEETSAVKDLAKPAVFISDGSKSVIVTPLGSRSIV
jgi:hypothetical protein